MKMQEYRFDKRLNRAQPTPVLAPDASQLHVRDTSIRMRLSNAIKRAIDRAKQRLEDG